MNYPMSPPSPPKPDATQPWHPETHLDLEGRAFPADLPLRDNVELGPRLRMHEWDTRHFSPREIRVLAREFFFTHPTASFACDSFVVLAYCQPIDVGAGEPATLEVSHD